jgi:hypothetical protein
MTTVIASAMRTIAAAVLAAATLLVMAAPGQASEATKIVYRCTHGESLGGFSQNGYKEALKHLPTEVIEYSECANEIRKAELAAAGGTQGGPGSGSNVPTPLTPSERQAVLNAHSHGSAPVRIDGRTIEPGVVHADIASVASTLPPSLLAILALVLAGGVAFGGAEAYKRIVARRGR